MRTYCSQKAEENLLNSRSLCMLSWKKEKGTKGKMFVNVNIYKKRQFMIAIFLSVLKSWIINILEDKQYNLIFLLFLDLSSNYYHCYYLMFLSWVMKQIYSIGCLTWHMKMVTRAKWPRWWYWQHEIVAWGGGIKLQHVYYKINAFSGSNLKPNKQTWKRRKNQDKIKNSINPLFVHTL